MLDNLYETLNERADLIVGPEKVLYFLSTDFALFLGKKRLFLIKQYLIITIKGRFDIAFYIYSRVSE